MDDKIANDSAERRYIETIQIQNAMRSTRCNIHYIKKQKEEKKERRRFSGFGDTCSNLHLPFDLLASAMRALKRDANDGLHFGRVLQG